jgi:uncharacterized membrane-anchored protein YhcB (DUF1043 family)
MLVPSMAVLLVALAARNCMNEYRQLMADVPGLIRPGLGTRVHRHLADPWNFIDVCSLVTVLVTVVRLVCHAETAANMVIETLGTVLLWVRVIQFLNGFDVTAAYVRMIMSVTLDMTYFMLILVVLIVGNAFTMMLIYPRWDMDGDTGHSSGSSSAGASTLAAGSYISFSAAGFSSLDMLFNAPDTKSIDNALWPTLATWHYILYVLVVPLIMLNLLIALMGGSYERVEQNTQNAMRRQRAELLTSLECLMCDEDKANPVYSPRWLHWYRPAEASDAIDGAEKGVINGVNRLLRKQSAEHQGQIEAMQDQIDRLRQEVTQQREHLDDKLDAILQAVTADKASS